jgi:bloom syndrome protein
VYCLSRDDTESVAGQIRDHTDISAAHYHAGMTPKQRMQVQNDWRTGRVQVSGAGWEWEWVGWGN